MKVYYLDGVEVERDAYAMRLAIAVDRVTRAAYDRARQPAPERPEDPEIAISALVSVVAGVAASSQAMGDWIAHVMAIQISAAKAAAAAIEVKP